MGVCLSTEPPDHNEEKCVLMKLNPCLQKWECCTNAPCLQGHQWEMYVCRKTCLNQFKPVTSGPPASSSLLRTCYDVCMYVCTYCMWWYLYTVCVVDMQCIVVIRFGPGQGTAVHRWQHRTATTIDSDHYGKCRLRTRVDSG